MVSEGRLALQSYGEACQARQESGPPAPAGDGAEMRYNASSHRRPLWSVSGAGVGSSTSSLTSSLCVRVLRVLRDAEPSPTVLPWPKAKKVPLSE